MKKITTFAQRINELQGTAIKIHEYFDHWLEEIRKTGLAGADKLEQLKALKGKDVQIMKINMLLHIELKRLKYTYSKYTGE